SAARGGSGLPYEGFTPFTLVPGGNRGVGVSVLVPGCPGGATVRNAGALVVGTVPVTWRWLGRTRVSDVKLNFRGALEAAPLCGSG
ncbi:MAG: hypothetical protein H7323_12085, partial [Frankiales bacterium]|nr:hypothetical protein [Frankiales bacterium]